MNEKLIAMEESQLLAPSHIDAFLAEMDEKYSGLMFAVDTAKGRKECASVAYEIAQTKTAVDAVGKKIVDKLKEQPKLVDAARKKIRDSLNALRDEVRKPLTKWELEQAERQARIDAAIAKIETKGGSLAECCEWLDGLQSLNLRSDIFGDRIEEAKAKLAEKITAQEEIVAKRIEADRLEREAKKLREENARLQREARESQLVKEAEERAARQERERLLAQEIEIDRKRKDAEIAIEKAKEATRLAEEREARDAEETKRKEVERAAKDAEEALRKEAASKFIDQKKAEAVEQFTGNNIGRITAVIVVDLIAEGKISNIALI